MGYHKDGEDFTRHEIKTFHRKGDQVRSEYERLNPDGTVTKSVAYGDCREGLRYRTFHMGLNGVVRELGPEEFIPRSAISAPQQQQQQRAPQQRQATLQQQQPASQQQQPRKAFAFIVEPKENDQTGKTWRIRSLNINQEKPAETPQQKEEQQYEEQQKEDPWWYETLKEAFREPKEEKIQEKPAPPPEPERKVSRNIFDLFDNDFFSFNPFRKALQGQRVNSPFNFLAGDSFFDRPLFSPFSRSLLEDF